MAGRSPLLEDQAAAHSSKLQPRLFQVQFAADRADGERTAAENTDVKSNAAEKADAERAAAEKADVKSDAAEKADVERAAATSTQDEGEMAADTQIKDEKPAAGTQGPVRTCRQATTSIAAAKMVGLSSSGLGGGRQAASRLDVQKTRRPRGPQPSSEMESQQQKTQPATLHFNIIL